MSKGRILIIEDEAIVADDILYCLQEQGYEVPLVCSSGEDALQALETQTVDLALVDVLLAGNIDGIETALQLRNRFQLPVVYLTSFTNESIIKRAKETTPSGYIVKPFKRRELLATVEMALYHGETQSSQIEAPKADFSGKLLIKVWLQWLKQNVAFTEKLCEQLPDELLQNTREYSEKNRALLQLMSELHKEPSSQISNMEQIQSLTEALFQILHPDRNVLFSHEPEADTVRCPPLLLSEILLFALDSVSQTEQDANLFLHAGLLPATDSNASFLKLEPGNHTRFQIGLKSSNSQNNTSSMVPLIQTDTNQDILYSISKSGGKMMHLSNEKGQLTGFHFYLPLK